MTDIQLNLIRAIIWQAKCLHRLFDPTDDSEHCADGLTHR